MGKVPIITNAENFVLNYYAKGSYTVVHGFFFTEHFPKKCSLKRVLEESVSSKFGVKMITIFSFTMCVVLR